MQLTRVLVCSTIAFVMALGLRPLGAQDAKQDAKPPAKDAPKPADKPKADGTPPALPSCPVMDEPIDFSVSAKTDAGPAYFCCAECVERYSKDPAKYAAKVSAQQALLKKRERVQVACPLGGEPIDGKNFVEHDGQKIGFCCEKCAGKFKADPTKFAAKVAGAYTYQTLCPVSGMKINTAHSADMAGTRVYFCCGKCAGAMSKDPAKFAPKLAAQGVNVDVKKLTPAKP